MMAANKVKLIDPKRQQVDQIHRENWEVMKPFVSFSYKAIKVIAVALIAIVKALPLLKPHEHKTTEIKSKGLTRR